MPGFRRIRARSPKGKSGRILKVLEDLERRVKGIEGRGRRRRSRRLLSSSSSSRSSSPAAASPSPIRHRRSRSLSRSRSRSRSRCGFPIRISEVRRSRDSPISSDAVAEDVSMADNIIFEGEAAQGSAAALSEDVLDILGPNEAPTIVHGPKINGNLVPRWESILQSGLSDEDRNKSLSKLPPPENFQKLLAPQLNAMLEKAISLSQIARDLKLQKLQQLVVGSISAVGQVLSSILAEPGGGDRHHIELLYGAGSLLADLWHFQTVTRRDLISINLSKEFQEANKRISLDNFLFGEDLQERLKVFKNLEDCGKTLKARPPKTASTPSRSRSNTSALSSRSLNYRAPTRVLRGAHRGRGNFRQQAPYPLRQQAPQQFRQPPRDPKKHRFRGHF
ncbi:uncharacterized protein LOC116164167 [Photinus pyralis]|uniref:uncharacterized protein LOC116164167 n=1 Tax=Photinus pyralis TaxID=7054 RepID=UPI00126782B0|nr:uncharacterized protein LOC116164167 [Photinus pyralis]